MQLIAALSFLLVGQVCRGASDARPDAEPQDYSSGFMKKYGGDYVDVGNLGADRVDGAPDHFQKYVKEFAPDYQKYTHMQKGDQAQYKKWVQMGGPYMPSAGGEASAYASMGKTDFFASEDYHRYMKRFTPSDDVDKASGSSPSQVVEFAAGPVDRKAQRGAEAQAEAQVEAVAAQQEEGSAASAARKAIEQLHDLLPKDAASNKIEAQKIAAAILTDVEDELQKHREVLKKGWDHNLEALGDKSLARASHDEAEQAVKAAEDADDRLRNLDHEAVKKMRHGYEESRSQAKAEACKLGKQAKEAARRAKKLGRLVEHHQRKAGISEEVYEPTKEVSEQTSERLEDAAETAREQVEDALEQRYQHVENLVEKHLDKFADSAEDLHRERRDALRHARQAMLEARQMAREQEREQQANKGAAAAADQAKEHSSPEKQEDKKEKSSPTQNREEASDKEQGKKAPTQFLAWESTEALSTGASGRILPVDVFATVAFLGCVIAVAGAFHARNNRQLNIEERPALG